MREIELTQGKVALVDDEDFEGLMEMGSWHAHAPHLDYWIAKTRHYGKIVFMHRIILDAPRGIEVDHINHNTLDNRRCNIRLCTRSQNLQNGRKRPGMSSQYKGVCWCERDERWVAQIGVYGNQKRLGNFKTEIDAARAYNAAAQKHFGKFALLNEIGGI